MATLPCLVATPRAYFARIVLKTNDVDSERYSARVPIPRGRSKGAFVSLTYSQPIPSLHFRYHVTPQPPFVFMANGVSI